MMDAASLTPQHITEIRLDLRSIFEEACRETLEVVKATAEATPDQHALSVDEMPWAQQQLARARDRVAQLLERIAKRIDTLPQAEQDDDTLIFRVVCRTPTQEGLLSEAVERFLTRWVVAAWFRMHPELKTEIDMERETADLNHLTLMNGGTRRPSYCY